MRIRSIKDVISQYWGACVVRFQAGYTPPYYIPGEFEKNLRGEVVNWKRFGGTWQESDAAIDILISAAATAYTFWYGQILLLPLPNNPTDEYRAWYESNH